MFQVKNQGCQIGFFGAKLKKFVFFETLGVKKNCLVFWLFLFNIWLFSRQLAHFIRLVFWLFKCLA